MNRRVWVALAGMLALAGCQTIPTQPQVVDLVDTAGARAAHRARIEALGLAAGDCTRPEWAMTGRVALSNGKDGGSGRIEWVQGSGQVRVGLTAPVTRQGWVLEAGAEGASLQGVPNGPLHGTDAATLLRDNTGWDIPVAGLGCWVRGAWASEAVLGEAKAAYGADGQLQRIEQADWIIDYADWRADAASGIALPGRVNAQRGNDRVRLIVDRWSTD